MKRIMYFILVGIMLTSLCGCNGNSSINDEERNDISSEVSNQPENEFLLGKTVNNTYKNDYMDISCSLSDEWLFYTEEQILELNNMATDYMEEDIAEALQKADIVYDMYAIHKKDNSNVNINYEKISIKQSKEIDLEEILKSQIYTIKQTYQNMGYEDIEIFYQKVQIENKEYDGLRVTAKLQNINFYGTVFIVRRKNYLANITVCSMGTDKSDAILKCFTIIQ